MTEPRQTHESPGEPDPTPAIEPATPEALPDEPVEEPPPADPRPISTPEQERLTTPVKPV